jgi:hypothetical protein
MTAESTIDRAAADLARVQSALDSAQQVLEVAGRAERIGARAAAALHVVVIALLVGGMTIGAVYVVKRLMDSRTSGTPGPGATETGAPIQTEELADGVEGPGIR